MSMWIEFILGSCAHGSEYLGSITGR